MAVGNGSDHRPEAEELEALRERVRELEGIGERCHSAEEALRRVQANLDALLENTDDFILFSDSEGSPVFFNSSYAAVMKALLGIDMRPGVKPHEYLEDPAARATWEECHRRVLGGESFKMEYPHKVERGAVRYFEVSYNPVRKDGAIVGFSEFTRDVTERKRGELALVSANDELERQVAARTRELQRSEARFRALTERSADITLIIDRDGAFTYVSPSIQRYGYADSDVIGHRPAEFTHPEDVAAVEQALAQAASAPGRAVEMTVFRARDANGTYLDLEGLATSMLDVHGVEGIVFNGRDVTERRLLEARLRQSEKMDAIGQLAGGIAHDFNNQLTGILAYADLLRLKLSDERHRIFAQHILHAAQRSADLTGQLLAFARRGHYRSAPTDVNQVLDELAELLRRSIDKRICVEVSRCDDVPVVVGDPGQLHNALLNLALNARDAMPDGGTLRLACRTTPLDARACDALALSATPRTYVKISVGDDGMGMDAETKQRMFEPFFTTKEPGKGTGMGLASVYGTVRSHDGAVDVTSELGVGTVVEVYLPAAPAEATGVSDEGDALEVTSGGRALIVDDEEVVRESLARLMAALDYEVCVCVDGLEATTLFQDQWSTFDLVILDMVMPRMDGRQTLRAMRAIDPDARILMVSGHTREGTGQGALDEGASGFLQKPFDLQRLAAEVSRVRKRGR